ncbi:MAG: hypothetical protein E7299_12150 [Lachnospiraceae bacterium]|nr:hypothetical protein [Lachnospiraceae bacterium]
MKKERIFWGILFILGAVFLLVSQTGPFKGFNIGAWDVIWTVILVIIFLKSLIRLHYFPMFFSLAFLGIIHAEVLGLTAIVPWIILGAALLLSIGCHIIFPSRKCDNVEFVNFASSNCSNTCESEVNFGATNHKDDNDFIRQEVNFSSCVKYVTSTVFKGAQLECNFGAMKIYFNDAQMQDNTACVFIENNFGGTEIFVPSTWRVENQIASVFGGVNQKGVCNHDGVHTLYLKGENNFGGITIFYI